MASILLIDDDLQVRAVLRTVLESDGHVVREAQDGIEGLKLYRTEPADLVICDIFMPEQDGLEFLYDLRQEFPQARVIAMTGGSLSFPKDFLRDARLLGATAGLYKPVRPDKLRAIVREVLQGVGKP